MDTTTELDNEFIVMIVGSTGAGKNTIMNNVEKYFGESIIKRYPSCTTRSPRESETHGIDYFFLTKEEMFKLAKEHRIVELKRVYNNIYGTDIKAIEETFQTAKIAIKDYDVQGYLNAKKRINYIRSQNNKGPIHILTILIDAPDELLVERIKARNDNTDVTAREQELIKDRVIKNHSQYDYRVMNLDIEKATSEVIEIIKDEYHKVTGKNLLEKKANITSIEQSFASI